MYKLGELKNSPQYLLASKQVAFLFFIRYAKKPTEIIHSGLSPLVLMDSGLHPATLHPATLRCAVGICFFWLHHSQNRINSSSSVHSILNLNSTISFSQCQEFTYLFTHLATEKHESLDAQKGPAKPTHKVPWLLLIG